MAIKKQYLKSKPICKVTFSVPAKNAKKVTVAGDFNKWDTKKAQLRKLKNGTFKGTIDIEKDKSYQFKYIIDGAYINEQQADGYVWNDFAGTENSLLAL
jgi:1,4-alpha-glucan branching enzyme